MTEEKEIRITWKEFKEWKEERLRQYIVDTSIDDAPIYGVQRGIKYVFTFGLFSRPIKKDKFPNYNKPIASMPKDEPIEKLREAHKNTTFKSPLTGRNKKVFTTNPVRKIISKIMFWYYNKGNHNG